MKNFSLLILLGLFLFAGCQKEEIENANKTFAIKDMHGVEVQRLPPDLLSSIYDNLMEKGRVKDANDLLEIYDIDTGYLKTAKCVKSINSWSSFINMPIDSSQMVVDNDTIQLESLKAWQQQYVYLYAHVRGHGDIGPFFQAPERWDFVEAPYFAGTVRQERRLEGMVIQTAQFLFPTRPDLKYRLVNPDGSRTSTGTWGQFVGTKGQSKAVIGLEMWSDTPGVTVWYKAHNQSTGWNGAWQNDGQFAGVYGKRLEAYAMQILQY